MDGLTSENGPFSFDGNVTTPVANPYSWTKLANVLYIDQPVGVGYSTGSNPATDNADVTQDFYNWLKAFYTVFPTLKTKNTYLMGESYAGVYVSVVMIFHSFLNFFATVSSFASLHLSFGRKRYQVLKQCFSTVEAPFFHHTNI